MSRLSETQIVALRQLRDAPGRIDKPTGRNLVRRGMAQEHVPGRFSLTAMGRRWIEEYVQRTGDGPERLKALLRF
jgi:hypothetical protein